MSKIVVIDVNLGISVEEIIAETARDLTLKAREQLDAIIVVAEAAKKQKEEKEIARQEQNTGIIKSLEEIFQDLEKAGDDGIAADDIMQKVETHITTTSAFTQRMNKFLSTKGNPFRLIRKTVNKQPRYIFTPFNATE